MKKSIYIIAFAALAIGFTSCAKEDALTPNEDFTGATNNGNNNGGGGDPGTSLPSDFRADTTTGKRAALLEDFTGVRCQFCPDGHVRAKNAKTALGADKFIILAVHAGIYANPSPGWPNFTSPYGAAIDAQADPAGYPAGSVSRFSASAMGLPAQNPGGMAMSRSHWQTAGSIVTGLDAPVNLGASATINPADNELTVIADIYFTDSITAEHKLNVAIVQDGLVSRQSDVSGIDNNYIQDNVLRDLITGQWGETIATSSDKGSFLRKTYTYTVPADYNGTGADGGGAVVLSDLKVVVFMTLGNAEVLNVVEVPVQ